MDRMDDPDAVRRRVREQLMQGASQIEPTAGGGVSSPHSPLDITTFAGINGELLALSGPRSPYPGPIGVIEPGALADLPLLDGDPVADIRLLGEPERRLLVFMKDRRICKNGVGR